MGALKIKYRRDLIRPKKFVNAIREEANYKLTENGALALRSTMSALVDLFGEIDSLRKREDSEITWWQ